MYELAMIVFQWKPKNSPARIIPIIESCSPGPFLELFARGDREGWDMWGNQATADYEPTWSTYKNHTTQQAHAE